MALLNYNIRQITNHNADALDSGNEPNYYEFRFSSELGASKPAEELPALKLSYICEPNAINIPIYIAFSGSTTYNRINIGKTGIFEIQPESRISDILTQEVEEEDIEFKIIGIKVPKGFSFSIDYIIAGDA